MLLSIGMNTKLAKEVGVFNIPAVQTCPGRTAFCERHCYAKRTEAFRPSARKKRKENYDATLKHLDFIVEIDKEIKEKRLKLVRIHESGDFYSQEYLSSWIKIAKLNPDTIFRAYTRSFQLDFSDVPGNMLIGYSVDPSTEKFPPKNVQQCIIVTKEEDCPSGYYFCKPISKDHKNYCGKSCKICWNKKTRKNVAFLKH